MQVIYAIKIKFKRQLLFDLKIVSVFKVKFNYLAGYRQRKLKKGKKKRRRKRLFVQQIKDGAHNINWVGPTGM